MLELNFMINEIGKKLGQRITEARNPITPDIINRVFTDSILHLCKFVQRLISRYTEKVL